MYDIRSIAMASYACRTDGLKCFFQVALGTLRLRVLNRGGRGVQSPMDKL